jgi:hypothetical protein
MVFEEEVEDAGRPEYSFSVSSNVIQRMKMCEGYLQLKGGEGGPRRCIDLRWENKAKRSETYDD